MGFNCPPLPIPPGAIHVKPFRGYLVDDGGYLVAVHPAMVRIYGGKVRVLPHRAANGNFSWRGPHGPRDSCYIPRYIKRAVEAEFDRALKAGTPYKNDHLPAPRAPILPPKHTPPRQPHAAMFQKGWADNLPTED